MRQLAGRLNRGWLAAIGVLLLLVGVVATLATTGLLGRLLAATGHAVVLCPTNASS